MTPDQVSGFFDAGESFVEGTIGALLVAFWVVVLAVHMARPYMLRHLRRFTLRLGADLWWILYVALREFLIVFLFLGGFIFFYPDVISGQDLPITGGLATACAFAVLVLKLVGKGEADVRNFRLQTVLLGLGAVLYVFPYILGVQVTEVGSDWSNQLAAFFVSSQNPDVALPLAYISAALVGLLAIVAVVYNLRQTSVERPRATEA